MLDTYCLFLRGPLRGTHDSIDRYAASLVRTSGWRRLPSLLSLRLHGGILGPDTAWAIGRLPASASRYVPSTATGGAIHMALKLWFTLRRSAKRGRLDTRSAGWLSHIVADLLDPAHQIGQPGRVLAKVFFVRREEDWDDPWTGSLLDPQERHNHFEWLMARTTVRDAHCLSALRQRQQTFREQLRVHSLPTVLHAAARRIADSGIWLSYVRHGSSPALQEKIRSEVLLAAPALIAALWETAGGPASAYSCRPGSVAPSFGW